MNVKIFKVMYAYIKECKARCDILVTYISGPQKEIQFINYVSLQQEGKIYGNTNHSDVIEGAQ